MIAVMKGSKKTKSATDFIQFISQPQPQADFARALLYAPANAKAYPLMTQEEKATLPSGHMGAASLQGRQAVSRILAQQRRQHAAALHHFRRPVGMTTSAAARSGIDLRRAVDRSQRRHQAWMLALMAPSVLFVTLLFVVPIALFMFRSIDNSELRGFLPHTVTAMAGWAPSEGGPARPARRAGVRRAGRGFARAQGRTGSRAAGPPAELCRPRLSRP